MINYRQHTNIANNNTNNNNIIIIIIITIHIITQIIVQFRKYKLKVRELNK